MVKYMESLMTKRRIFILNGHPAKTSLNRTLAEEYAAAARDAGHEVRISHLNDLSFDPDHGFGGYSELKPLEPALETVSDDIEWAEHVVLTTPMWWGGPPAKLKGLIDRAFVPGRFFDTRKVDWKGMPQPMLTGRTGRMIVTTDTPMWFMRFVYHSAMLRQLRDQVFGFVGIKPARITYFSDTSHPKPGSVDRMIANVRSQASVAG